MDDPSLHPRLASLLDVCLRDNRQAWELRPDGTYVQRRPPSPETERATHRLLAEAGR